MGLTIILAIVFAAMSIGLFWLVLFFPLKWSLSGKRVRKIRWISAMILGFVFTYYFLFISPSYNHDFAILDRKGDYYELTFSGERKYMSHDPISALSRDTYTDTIVLKIPRKKGIVKGEEIIKEGGYPIQGTLVINDGMVNVELFYNNYDDSVKDPFSCNGRFKLK
jgi:hypothetical protein